MIDVIRKSTFSISKYRINHRELNSRRYEDQIVFESFKEDSIIESMKIKARNLSMFNTLKARMKQFD